MTYLRAAAVFLVVDAAILLGKMRGSQRAPRTATNDAAEDTRSSSTVFRWIPAHALRIVVLVVVARGLWLGESWAWWAALLVSTALALLAFGATVMMSAGGAWRSAAARPFVRDGVIALVLELAVIGCLLIARRSPGAWSHFVYHL